MRYPPIYHAPDDGQPQGGTEQGQAERLQGLLTKHNNDAMGVAQILLAENYELRRKNATLRTDNDALRAKTPADGARVLSKDEAAQWAAYQALGAPDALKQTVDASTKTADELATLKRERTTAEAAVAAGYKPAVLAKLPSLAGKDLIVKDVEIDGKPAKAAFVAADGKEHALAEYIAAHDPEFLPALTADAPKPTPGTPYVRQSAGGEAPKLSPVQTHIQRTYNRQGAKDNGTNR